MNALSRSLAQANAVRVRLGEGEPGLMDLLGGFSAGAESDANASGYGATGAVSRLAVLRHDVRVGGGVGGSGGGTASGGPWTTFHDAKDPE